MRDDRMCDGGKPTYDAGGGSLLPNSFQVPNLYVDRLLPLLTDAEWRVLTYAARRIFGFGTRQEQISLSQFVEGITTRQGVRLDYGTGLKKKAVIDTLRSLTGFGILLVVTPPDEARHIPAEYALQLHEGSIDFAALHLRWVTRQETDKGRTAAARKARGSSHEPGRGLSDEPASGVSATEDSGLVGQRNRGLSHEPTKPRGNPEETQSSDVPQPAPADGHHHDPLIAAKLFFNQNRAVFHRCFGISLGKPQLDEIHERLSDFIAAEVGLDAAMLAEAEENCWAYVRQKARESGNPAPVRFAPNLLFEGLQRVVDSRRAESQRNQGDTAGAGEGDKPDLPRVPRSLADFPWPEGYSGWGPFPEEWRKEKEALITACWGTTRMSQQTMKPWQGARH